jgi:hypothetical protein
MANMSDKKAEVWNIIAEHRATYSKDPGKHAPQFVIICAAIHEGRKLARYLIEEQKMPSSSVRIAWGGVSMYQYDGTFGAYEVGNPDVEVLIVTERYGVHQNFVNPPSGIHYSSYPGCETENLASWCDLTMHMANLGYICASVTLIDFRDKDDAKLAKAIVRLFPLTFGPGLSEHRVDTTAIKAKVKALEASGL